MIKKPSSKVYTVYMPLKNIFINIMYNNIIFYNMQFKSLYLQFSAHSPTNGSMGTLTIYYTYFIYQPITLILNQIFISSQ